MSVIVKGVDVPNDCDGCWHPTCNLWIGTDVGNRHKDCPISPLTEKHGRLIDADSMKALWAGAKVEGDIGCLLDARPTIVEAEGKDG